MDPKNTSTYPGGGANRRNGEIHAHHGMPSGPFATVPTDGPFSGGVDARPAGPKAGEFRPESGRLGGVTPIYMYAKRLGEYIASLEWGAHWKESFDTCQTPNRMVCGDDWINANATQQPPV